MFRKFAALFLAFFIIISIAGCDGYIIDPGPSDEPEDEGAVYDNTYYSSTTPLLTDDDHIYYISYEDRGTSIVKADFTGKILSKKKLEDDIGALINIAYNNGFIYFYDLSDLWVYDTKDESVYFMYSTDELIQHLFVYGGEVYVLFSHIIGVPLGDPHFVTEADDTQYYFNLYKLKGEEKINNGENDYTVDGFGYLEPVVEIRGVCADRFYIYKDKAYIYVYNDNSGKSKNGIYEFSIGSAANNLNDGKLIYEVDRDHIIGDFLIYGDKIYMVLTDRYNENNNSLISLNMDGSVCKILDNNVSRMHKIGLYKGMIYYFGKDYVIYRMNIDGSGSKAVTEPIPWCYDFGIVNGSLMCSDGESIEMTSNSNVQNNGDHTNTDPVTEGSDPETSSTHGTTEVYGDLSVGDYIYFGKYPQNSDEPEAIKWRVIAVEDGRAMLISEYLLDCKPYNKTMKHATWETCTLRKWLNEDFYNSAFDDNEKKKIVLTHNINPKNAETGIKGGNDTDDYVFLLSFDETERYFTTDSDRIAKVTPYAKKNGAHENEGIGRWWLRSPGSYDNYASYVSTVGKMYFYGYRYNDGSRCVRPVIVVAVSA